MNSDQTAPLCDLWVSGDCAGARAAACTARHFYLDSDSGDHQCRGKTKFATDIASKKVKRVRRQFSSPYRARLVIEQISVEREEINIESGEKECWVEIKERELVDLTGREATTASVFERVENNDEGRRKEDINQHNVDPYRTPQISVTMHDEYLNMIIYDYMAEINQKLAKKFKKETKLPVELPKGAPNLREVVSYFALTAPKYKRRAKIMKLQEL